MRERKEEGCIAGFSSYLPNFGHHFGCILPRGHDGPHQPGGICFKHGDYLGEGCPKRDEEDCSIDRGESR